MLCGMSLFSKLVKHELNENIWIQIIPYMATSSEVLNRRRAGILLHITSLPSTLGLGSLGKHAYRFIDNFHKCVVSV